jgi:magnesium transporter
MGLDTLVWRDGKLVASGETPERNLDKLAHNTADLVWVGVNPSSIVNLKAIGEAFGFDPHTVEDALGSHERPKLIRSDNYYFATLTTFGFNVRASFGTRLTLQRISVYATGNCLITVQADDSFNMTPVLQRWTDDPDLVKFGVDGLFQALLDFIVDEQLDSLDALDEDLDSLIDELFCERPNTKSLQRRAFGLRRELAELRHAVAPMRDIVSGMIHLGESLHAWPMALLGYYEDLSDHVHSAAEHVDSLRDLVESVHETNLALNDSRMNEVMKKLAAWAAIIAVPTFITGLYGMNVPYPGFNQVWGWFMALGLVLAAVTTLFIVFRKNDWL